MELTTVEITQMRKVVLRGIQAAKPKRVVKKLVLNVKFHLDLMAKHIMVVHRMRKIQVNYGAQPKLNGMEVMKVLLVKIFITRLCMIKVI